MRSVEIFAGAGGLAIGMSNVGFRHAAVVEWDHHACETFRENQRNHAHFVDEWPLHEVDARIFDYGKIKGDISVVSGGPPCQPFSMGGKHRGEADSRNMFPEAVRAVRELAPAAFIFENVKGLVRSSFSEYLSYIHLQLQFPGIYLRESEEWAEHHSRLKRYSSQASNNPTYDVYFKVVNAADYGVPQKRERVFFVGFKSDLNINWDFPSVTHSKDALLYAKWVTGSYWYEHNMPVPSIGPLSPDALKRLAERGASIRQLRWKTVRDAIRDLPDPEINLNNRYANHVHIAGARAYVGHTGSSLDEPSKTLKAGSHGVPGGENMLVKDDGSVRYMTVREAARIQTFPDDFEFYGSWGQTMKQLGNAVPVELAEVIAKSVAKSLGGI